MPPEASFPTVEELETLLTAFETCVLPSERWTHTAHLLVGLMMIWRSSPDEALARLRAGIRAYNSSVGTRNSATSGYHETITRFYVHIIAAHLSGGSWRDPAEAAANLLGSTAAARDYPLSFYSRELLFSPGAREEWREPDLQPLPGVVPLPPQVTVSLRGDD